MSELTAVNTSPISYDQLTLTSALLTLLTLAIVGAISKEMSFVRLPLDTHVH